MRILITGASGFIGSHCLKLLSKNHEVIGLDKVNGKRIDVPIVLADLRSPLEHMLDGVDVIVNFAAETFVDYSISTPRKFIYANVIGTYNLLEAARRIKLKKFIQISTDEVYGSCMKGFFCEKSTLCPGNPYSASKASADMLCLSHMNTFDIPVTIVRPENNYGTFQGNEKFIPTVIRKMLNGEDVILYGDGKHQRMWLHVEDTCEAIKHIIESKYNAPIYNIGSKQERENRDIVKLIGQVLKVPYHIRHVPDKIARPGHDRRYAIDTHRINSSGWKPKHKLENSLPEVVEWYKNNQWWFQN